MSDFESFSPEDYTYDFVYTYTFEYTYLENLPVKSQASQASYAEPPSLYRQIPYLSFCAEQDHAPVYRSMPCLTLSADGAESSCADGAESSCADGAESSCADGAESSSTDGAESLVSLHSTRQRSCSSSSYYSSYSPTLSSLRSRLTSQGSFSSSSSSENPSTMNTNYIATIGTHMYDNPGTISSATTAYVSRERLAALEFLEKNISTIISEQVRKHYDGYTGSSIPEE